MNAIDRIRAARAELAAAEAELLGDRSPAVAALARLFNAMFSDSELRRGLRYYFPNVAAELPGASVSPGEVVDSAVRGLLLTGASAASLRPWLVSERPRRVAEIDTVLAKWGAP